MENRRTESNRDVIDQRREVIPPAAPQERPARAVGVYETAPEGIPPDGPRVRWGGVMSGVIVALGLVLLLTALGLAIGLTAVGDPRAATAGTATGLGRGAGFWAALPLLVGYFLGGLVSTMVTDRPDRDGALVHGALVWTLASECLLWLLGQGISLGASGLLGALNGLTHTATSTVSVTVAGGGDLAHQLGLTDATRLIDWLDEPQTVALFASVTGLAPTEPRTTLAQFRTRVEAIRDNPEQVAAEVRGFLAPYKERAHQQALKAAAAVQEGATVGS